MPRKSFTNQVVNVFPQKLHHQNKQGDEKGKNKRTKVGPEN